MIAVPVYNCQFQISRVIQKLSQSGLYSYPEMLIIDNCSEDNSLKVAKDNLRLKKSRCFKITLIKNKKNYGLGGSHKVAFEYCLKKSYEGVVVLHGDDQGNIYDFEKITLDHFKRYDCWLGARFMEGSNLSGYSLIRILGNKLFNTLYTLCTSKKIFDMGAGLNYFGRNLLLDKSYLLMPDDLTFNNAYLLYLLSKKINIIFFPISWREEDQVSNAKYLNQSMKLLRYLYRFILFRFIGIPLNFYSLKRSLYEYEFIDQR